MSRGVEWDRHLSGDSSLTGLVRVKKGGKGATHLPREVEGKETKQKNKTFDESIEFSRRTDLLAGARC